MTTALPLTNTTPVDYGDKNKEIKCNRVKENQRNLVYYDLFTGKLWFI